MRLEAHMRFPRTNLPRGKLLWVGFKKYFENNFHIQNPRRRYASFDTRRLSPECRQSGISSIIRILK